MLFMWLGVASQIQLQTLVLRIPDSWDVMLCFWVSSSQNLERLWYNHVQV